MPRDRRAMPEGEAWPECRPPERSSEGDGPIGNALPAAAIGPRVPSCIHAGMSPMAMEDAPDVDVLTACHVEDEVGVALEWPGAQSRQVQFVSVVWRSGFRVGGDVAESSFHCIDEGRGRRPCRPPPGSGRPPRPHPVGPRPGGRPASASRRRGWMDSGAKILEISCIGSNGRSRFSTCEQQASEVLAVLIATDQLANVRTTGPESPVRHLCVDKRLEGRGKRDVHRAHMVRVAMVDKNWQTMTRGRIVGTWERENR